MLCGFSIMFRVIRKRQSHVLAGQPSDGAHGFRKTRTRCQFVQDRCRDADISPVLGVLIEPRPNGVQSPNDAKPVYTKYSRDLDHIGISTEILAHFNPVTGHNIPP
jgi:hypothetical protein